MTIDERATRIVDAIVYTPGAGAAFRSALDAYRIGDTAEAGRYARIVAVAIFEAARTGEDFGTLCASVVNALGAMAFGETSHRGYRGPE